MLPCTCRLPHESTSLINKISKFIIQITGKFSISKLEPKRSDVSAHFSLRASRRLPGSTGGTAMPRPTGRSHNILDGFHVAPWYVDSHHAVLYNMFCSNAFKKKIPPTLDQAWTSLRNLKWTRRVPNTVGPAGLKSLALTDPLKTSG